jgi:hypothetical protein
MLRISRTELNQDVRPLSDADIEEVNGGVLGLFVGLAVGFATGVILEETKPFSGTLEGRLHR